MNDSKINAAKITKPIQLLAVWLIGLIAIEASLLTASGTVSNPYWLPAFYGISAVCIIPLFLVLIFLLQTKYRPQIQGDEYYAKYLDKNTMQFVEIPSKSGGTLELIKQEIKLGLADAQKDIQNLTEKIEKGGDKEGVESLLIDSNEKLKSLEKIVKFSSVNLKINNTLPTFRKIVEKSKQIGFTTFEEFGTNLVPSNFLVSFSKNVSPILIKEILIEIIPLGASMISKIDEAGEDKWGNVIFVGSYLYNSKKNTTIDQGVLDRLSSITENSVMSELI